MSADNWTTCPRCIAEARDAIEAERHEVMAAYGIVSVEEFDKARAAIKELDPDDFTTFREDYEFYGASDGEIHADYSGVCSKCGLRVELEVAKRFWP